MRVIPTAILFICVSTAVAGQTTNRDAIPGITGHTMAHEGGSSATIQHHVTNWRLLDLGSLSDTIPVDTIQTGFQIHEPANRDALVNIRLGNLGAPYLPAMVSGHDVRHDFIFTRGLQYYFPGPGQWRYFKTRTPYTNLYYQYAGPRRRSEEALGVLFTQNINRHWNAGFEYRLISSIGRYEAQRVENRNFRFFSSYSGINYQVHGSYAYNRTDHMENGGIANDQFILNPEDHNFEQEENIPVNFTTASTRVDNHQLFISQALRVGNVKVTGIGGESITLPLGSLNHIFHLSRFRRRHEIDNLRQYMTGGTFFYRHILIDSTATNDILYHTNISNTFQVRFNEEANEILRFGFRLFITNNILSHEMPALPVSPAGSVTSSYLPANRFNATSTHLGGQLFKNRGNNLRWNAGARFFFQGYRSGDSELTGNLESSFRLAKDTTTLFASGGLYLATPSFLEERYASNHFAWDERFNPVKTLRLRGGIKIPTRRVELTAESRLINDHIYWNKLALPTQTTHYLSVHELRLFNHLVLGNFHNRSTILYQLSSHPGIFPLPEWAIYNSFYYENLLFGVLNVQLGFDVRYTTAWYAPAYMPATGQFHVQETRKVGNYPFIDIFLNMQLNRSRIFIKMDHVNMGYFGNNFFHTINYPANPRSLKFGLSWNFYD